MIERFSCERLEVEIHPTRLEMGRAAAGVAAQTIRSLLDRDGSASIILSAARSQLDFLACLSADHAIDWPRVKIFHVDEYIGPSADHPASLRRYLAESFLDRVHAGQFFGLDGEAPDIAAECSRYAALLREHRPGLAVLGIGEGADYLAYNDPSVCKFEEQCDVKPVLIESAARLQQVHDGVFAKVEDVPPVAYTVTLSFLMEAPRVIVVVPGATKSKAVRDALGGPVTTRCPASILRRHPNANLYLDVESAALLS